jgi:hypothetical protein
VSSAPASRNIPTAPRTITPSRLDLVPLPGACDPTIVGPPPPGRLPAPPRANCVLPDLDTCTLDDVADLAANVSGDSHSSDDDLWALMGSSLHVRAICTMLGRLEFELDTMTERNRLLELQLGTSNKLGAALDVKVGELAKQLREERLRNAREIAQHTQTIERLASATIESCRLLTKLDDVTEELRLARQEPFAQPDPTDCEGDH